jgi:hypothetical protein
MFWRIATTCVILGDVALIGFYDVLANKYGGNSATISRQCLNTSLEIPGFRFLMCALFGVLMGHLFVWRRPGSETQDQELFALAFFVGLPLLVISFDLIAMLLGMNPRPMHATRCVNEWLSQRPYIEVFLGYVFGVMVGNRFLAQHVF